MAEIASPVSPYVHPSRGLRWLAVLSFAFLAVIILAGTRPFVTDLVAEVGRSGRGSMFEALLYLLATLSCLLVSLHLSGARLVNGAALLLLGLLVYCAVTLSWSATPSAGIVRLSQLALVTMAIAAAVRTLGPQTILDTTYAVLVAILAVNLVSVQILPGALHQAGEIGTHPLHITSWKGVHIHKNYAGPVAAMTVIMAMAHVFAGRYRHLVVALAAFVFLLETNSKASLYVLVLALAIVGLTKVLCRAMGRGATRFVLVGVLLAVPLSLPLLAEPFAQLMNDPYALTGRVELWHAMSTYLTAHPWTGSGFGSFWRIGDQSPILHLTDGWAIHTGQGHSGYLDTTVTIGLPGLALTVLLFVVVPCVLLLTHLSGRSFCFDVFAGFTLFAWVHNSVETSLLSANHPVFCALLVAVFGLHALRDAPTERPPA